MNPDYLFNAASAAMMPTGDVELDKLYDDYPRQMPIRPDFPNYYRFLYYLAPRINRFLELGCRTGAASYHVRKGNEKAAIFALDHSEEFLNKDLMQRISFIRSDSKDPDTAKCFRDEIFDAILIDTDHSYESVKAEYNLWRPKVRPGGLIMFDDIDAPEFGVKRFWDELAKSPPANPLLRLRKFSFSNLHPENWGFGVLMV